MYLKYKKIENTETKADEKHHHSKVEFPNDSSCIAVESLEGNEMSDCYLLPWSITT
jgi:hypothetical protein